MVRFDPPSPQGSTGAIYTAQALLEQRISHLTKSNHELMLKVELLDSKCAAQQEEAEQHRSRISRISAALDAEIAARKAAEEDRAV